MSNKKLAEKFATLNTRKVSQSSTRQSGIVRGALTRAGYSITLTDNPNS